MCFAPRRRGAFDNECVHIPGRIHSRRRQLLFSAAFRIGWSRGPGTNEATSQGRDARGDASLGIPSATTGQQRGHRQDLGRRFRSWWARDRPESLPPRRRRRPRRVPAHASIVDDPPLHNTDAADIVQDYLEQVSRVGSGSCRTTAGPFSPMRSPLLPVAASPYSNKCVEAKHCVRRIFPWLQDHSPTRARNRNKANGRWLPSNDCSRRGPRAASRKRPRAGRCLCRSRPPRTGRGTRSVGP
jgi:hypothetical protein